MSLLTDKRHRRTRAEIHDRAMALFGRDGFHETSMADVAEAAGVSRRTAYRHFATKDDLVFEQPRRWLELFESTIADRRPGEATRDLVRRALMDLAAFIQADPEPVLTAYRVLIATPSLRARHGESDAIWRALCTELIATDLEPTPATSLQAATAASALIGGTNAGIAIWASDPKGDLVATIAAVLDQLDSIWPDPTRCPPPKT